MITKAISNPIGCTSNRLFSKSLVTDILIIKTMFAVRIALIGGLIPMGIYIADFISFFVYVLVNYFSEMRNLPESSDFALLINMPCQISKTKQISWPVTHD